MTTLVRTYSLCRSCLNLRTQSALAGYISPYSQIRFAGHAKWQNIKSTKTLNDQNKAKLIGRYVLMVRRAIIAANMQTDPKINTKLGDILNEAYKVNVPKATLDRAIVRATNMKLFPTNLEIQGPGGCAVIARAETDSVNNLRREVRKAIKKYDSSLMSEDTLIKMFRGQGFIRTATKLNDNREVNQDFAEEAAIMADAQEVLKEEYDQTDDPNLSENWVFITDADSMNQTRGELEKQGFKVLSSVVELVAYKEIDFGREVSEKVAELVKVLTDIDQVIDVYHNVAPSKE